MIPQITGYKDKHEFERNGIKSTVYLMDCIEGMKQFPDKKIDLAVVDPPYGINAESGYGQSNNKNIHNKVKVWDKQTPTAEYFNELKRVSKNQIVFGANYFIENLGSTRCFICWDKQQQGRNFADCEFAWTSFDRVAKLITVRYLEPHECNIYNTIKRIHPTQKPIKLYDWIFKEFASEGNLILDTHLGSGSSRIAAYKAGLDFVSFEIDQEYFDKSVKRFEDYTSQLNLF
jgi:site-specific DNA-methyltransferase (adenine-specific)